MKILVDCLGADHSPEAQVEGALLALKEKEDLEVVLVGDENAIREELKKYDYDEKRVEVCHAPEEITGEDKPTDAIRLKKQSSLIVALKALKGSDELDALVSCGATGSLVAASTLLLPRIRGMRRPAFCPILPTMTGGIVGICDSGANVDITVEQLQQFALVGSRYLECSYGIDNPRVALLNIGVESEKGDELRKNAYQLLSKTEGIHFVGNMESRDLLSGKYDLVVCDGFSGNVLCKATEGTALELLKKIKKDIMSSIRYKIGALFMKKMFMEEKEFMNYQNYGGSVLLGTEKIVVKGHGSSKATAVRVCILQAYRMVETKMNEKIQNSLSNLEI